MEKDIVFLFRAVLLFASMVYGINPFTTWRCSLHMHPMVLTQPKTSSARSQNFGLMR